MPQLTIGDKSVTVGDEFLKLSPEQQNATVAQIAQQIGAAAAPAAPEAAAPAGGGNMVNDTVRAAATGVPIVGGLMNKLDAATNAALAPMLNRFFDEKDQLQEPSFSERYAHSLRDQEGADKRFAKEHPVIDTAAQLAGGIAATAPFMAAAPKAFGITGTLPEMVKNGAISGAALSGADAVTRGEDVGPAAAVGGIVGGAAGPVGKGVGKVVSAIADRVRPAPVVPQMLEDVAGVKVPLSQVDVSQDPALSAEAQVMLRGGRGDAAQAAAQGFRDLQDTRVNQARDAIGASLNPAGTGAPQDAAERIAAELIAQEQARQAAEAGVTAGPMSPAQQAADMARAMAPDGQLRAAAPVDAGELLSDRLAAARNTAKADYQGKYAAVDAAPGEFAPGSAGGFGNDVQQGLRSAAVSLDQTNTPKALNALRVIDEHLNGVAPGQPRELPGAPAGASTHAQDVADIRAKFGDQVAAAYDRQKQAAAPVLQPSNSAPAAPKAQSLLEFLASKGGLGPDAELAAIGGERHTVSVEGVGRRKLVRQGGDTLDYAREAAMEAGYLPEHSTPRDLLDAIDAEMRGQKRFPEGFEGHLGKREAAAMSEREQAEFDRHMSGFEDDLAAAGHSELGPEVKDRAVKLMANDGLDADTAVEHAFRQLEQEDAAGVARGSGFPGDSAGFPGDRQKQAAGAGEAVQTAKSGGAWRQFVSERMADYMRSEGSHGAAMKRLGAEWRSGPNAAEAAKATGSGFTMRDVEQVRKQISTLYGDARRAMLGGGSGSDLHALEHIRDLFDARVEKMLAEGKFSGDGPAVLKLQQEARAAFADYKAKFAKRGPGDAVGAAVEKILGKFSDTRATPDEVIKLAYGSPNAPGGDMPVKIAQRIESIFGRNSAEFGAYKQGLFAHLTAGEPEAAAERIRAFLDGPKRLLAQTVFSQQERAALGRYADRLAALAPKQAEPGRAAAAIRRYTGADGAPGASPQKIIADLMGSSGKGTGVDAPLIAAALKQRLSPEGFNQLRGLAFKSLTEAGEGKIPYEAQALSQRLHEFLNGSGSQLAKVLYTPQELDLMRKLASVYRQMIPVKGTTNPSGTAPMLARMAGGLRSTLLPLLGLTHGGLPGAAVGAVLDKGVTAARNANDARKAVDLFYGPQARRLPDPRFSKGLGLLSAGSMPAINQARSK